MKKASDPSGFVRYLISNLSLKLGKQCDLAILAIPVTEEIKAAVCLRSTTMVEDKIIVAIVIDEGFDTSLLEGNVIVTFPFFIDNSSSNGLNFTLTSCNHGEYEYHHVMVIYNYEIKAA